MKESLWKDFSDFSFFILSLIQFTAFCDFIPIYINYLIIVYDFPLFLFITTNGRILIDNPVSTYVERYISMLIDIHEMNSNAEMDKNTYIRNENDLG